MPRLPRNSTKTNLFHNMVQGINKNFIFNSSQDINYYIRLMYELNDEHNIKIIAYCIMNNHAHMLLKTDNLEELSKYMQRINIRFSIYYNKKYQKIGYVFRDRYKSQGIYTEEHLYNCIRYIFNNPVKAGICNSPEEYPYSNYKNVRLNSKIKMKERYYFEDTEEDIEINCKDSLKEILGENNLEIKDLIKNKEVLVEIITIMKKQYRYSLRKISKELGICRETIRKVYNK